jgi:4-aminobutyrate aminotransferase-like enzyme/Ser/Thr protein kinase RdoA (MazF antagonist)/murein DD-endopeptidase MepM/ murein hydrolase activator NlpD
MWGSSYEGVRPIALAWERGIPASCLLPSAVQVAGTAHSLADPSMIRTQERPEITPEQAAAAVRDHFGITGTLTPLDGERDRNFLLAADTGTRYVVKVTSPEEPDAHLDFETRLLAWLGGGGDLPVPALVPTRSGALIARPGAMETPWRIRVLEHLPGRILGAVRPVTPALLQDLGRRTAELSIRLASYTEHPPYRPDFAWALARAGRIMEAALDLHEEPNRRLAERCLGGFRDAEPLVCTLPPQVVHGDLNDHNVLVGAGGAVTGLLDFGDAHEAPAVFDLAITMAYAVLGQPDVLVAAAHVAAGYHEVRPLSEAELAVLFPLVRARLAASVSIAASRRQGVAEVDPYLLVSERPAWDVIRATDSVHPRLARGVLRTACGLPADPRGPALVEWLRACTPRPVMAVPSPPGTTVLDLSVGSPILDGHDTDDTGAFTRRVRGAMAEAGASLGIGRYREPRGLYLSEAFAGTPSEMPERRTVHMGIDLFDEAGAEVRAPLDGKVFSVHDNDGRLDYGPTVILQHEAPDGPFWTLYGHLERASVAGLTAGEDVAAGQVLARVGPPPENGDWPPHLHFQIMTDLLGHRTDFPGVVTPRDVAVWSSFLPDPNLLLRLDGPTTWAPAPALQERRRRLLGPSLSLSYAEPVRVVRGTGAYLYDEWGREYLDGVNNVAHVGHEHPHVVRAGRRQMGVLNTNTRYLHPLVLDYAERLLGLFPDPLSVCFFVNSGSEANELALRMARTVTGGAGVVTLEGGYHGNTQGLVDVSHYKFSRAGGQGPPPWVRAAAMPDDYRGLYRRGDGGRAAKFAAHVEGAFADLAGDGQTPAAFLAECVLSCGGQVEPPEGYFTAAYGHAREAGALCIADEVQIGFGRVGTHWWGFERHGVVPDIVTLGKPIGNGHPMGAVVTTRAIAEGFANGMEFFSTFGGNPVSAAIGLAVLEVLETEGLKEHAQEVGNHFRAGLTALMERHEVVGDVRGPGLFLGVEFITDRTDLRPHRQSARYVVSRMKEKGILLSTDGPDDNVIKIKPPLPFSRRDADRVVAALDEVLAEDGARP